jgi:hypothetical protein
MDALREPRASHHRMAEGTFSLRPARVVARLARGEIWYAVGRFGRMRRAYSQARALLDRMGREPSLAYYPTSLFPDLDVAQTVAGLHREGVVCGLRLPAEILAEITDYAARQPFVPLQGGPPLGRGDLRDGRLPSGQPAVIGRVIDPEACAAVHRVVYDPALLSLARSYLGYRPGITRTQLHWSFVSDAPPEYRRQLGQTIDYHFDVSWFNFLFVFFYLTSVDRRSGAHAIIRGSHRSKPVSMLWHSARQPDDAVLRRYGTASELVIEGAAGSGFVEDASCFHKVLAPVARERLALFIHYT